MANSEKFIDYDDDETSRGSGIRTTPSPKAEPPKTAYQLTMGLRRSDPAKWLVIEDHQYFEQHHIRTKLFECKKPMVVQCRPRSEAACIEALGLVADFLTEKHPDKFRRCRISPELDSVEIIRTGEIFKVGAPFYTMEPLEIAARLAMEDFSVLMTNGEGKNILEASATLFPAGWSVKDRLGWSLTDLHGDVPPWKENLGMSVEKLFSRITPNAPMERSSVFVQIADRTQPLSESFCRLDSLHGGSVCMMPWNILIRQERQVFRRLPRSGALLFSVKTYMHNLIDLSLDELRAFAAEVRKLPDDVAGYKGRHIWGDCVLKFCDATQKEVDEVKRFGELPRSN